MSDIVGHRPYRRVASDLRAIGLVARHARRIARVHVLRPSGATFLEFRTITGPSFYSRLRLIPFDQAGETVEFQGTDADGRRTKTTVGPTLLQIEFWPIRVFVLNASGCGNGPLQWQDVSASSSLSDREAVAAAEALMTGEPTESPLTVHLRNRQAAQPLPKERQNSVRRLLSLHRADDSEPLCRPLRTRSIYIGEFSTNDDLKAQLALALMQAKIIPTDSTVPEWFRDKYLAGFLSRQARGRDGAAEICTNAFAGLWRNAGDAEFAPAWRLLVKSWVRWSEYHHGPARRNDSWNDNSEESTSNWNEAVAVPAFRKKRRDVWYATPLNEPAEAREPLSIGDAARLLGISPRHVYRLVKKGRLRPLKHRSVLFDPVEVAKLANEAVAGRALKRERAKTFQRLIRESRGRLSPEGARKAEYRKRKQITARLLSDSRGSSLNDG